MIVLITEFCDCKQQTNIVLSFNLLLFYMYNAQTSSLLPPPYCAARIIIVIRKCIHILDQSLFLYMIFLFYCSRLYLYDEM